jgi:hypothetical protein
MDQRGLDEIGLSALGAMGAAILGQPVPSTMAWTQNWSAQGHPYDSGGGGTGSGTGFRDQVSGGRFGQDPSYPAYSGTSGPDPQYPAPGAYTNAADSADPGSPGPGVAYYPPRPYGPWTSRVGGLLVKTPDEIRTREALVDGKFRTMDSDVHANVDASTSSGGQFVHDWFTFKATWDQFLADNSSTASILLTGTGTVDRQITAFENELFGWQNALHQAAPQGQFTTPPITSTVNTTIEPNPATVPSKPSSGMPWWGISLLTIGGLGLLAYLGLRAYGAVNPMHFATEHLAGAHHGHDPAGPEPSPRYPHIPVYGY